VKIKVPEMIRVKDTLYEANGATHQKYASISLARKASRLWQQAKGLLGDGRLRVADKPPS